MGAWMVSKIPSLSPYFYNILDNDELNKVLINSFRVRSDSIKFEIEMISYVYGRWISYEIWIRKIFLAPWKIFNPPHTHYLHKHDNLARILLERSRDQYVFQVLYIHVQSVSKDERLQHPAKDVISAFNEYTTNTLEAFYVMKKVRDAYYLP